MENKEKSKKNRILITIAILLAGSIVILFSVAGVLTFFTKKSILASFQSPLLYVIAAILFLGIVFAVVFDIRLRGSKRVLKVNVDLENSHFMSMDEIKKNKGFTTTKFTNLSEVNDGIPIIAELKKNDIDIVLKEPIHTLVIGATGTGKTTAFVSPLIEILLRTKTKPSIVITDPKGELFAKHANSFKENGYIVNIIDLSDVYHSTKWNPFNDIMRKTQEMLYSAVEQKNGKYYVGGKEYLTNEDAYKACKERAIQLKDEIYVDIQDLVYTMCPVENKHDATWQRGARDLIFAFVLSFWEDVRDGYMRYNQFNLYNLYRNISDYAKGECEELIAYFATRDETSRTRGLSNTVLVSTDRTLSSYLGDVNQYMNWMADGGIAALTSENEIEFMDFDEKPNVLFFKIPDEKENRYKLVTLFITQMYKALVEKATRNKVLGKTENQELLRNVYFMMDEFGNLPKLYNMDKIVTIGRSRHIFMIPVIQDFNQLDDRYGKEVAATVRSNCNIQIFIGSNDENTRRAVSEACGKKKVKKISYNENKDMSVSTSAESVPIIYPNELEHLNDPANGILGNTVITSLGNYPIKSVITPVFKAKQFYKIKKTDITQGEFNTFNEKKNFYDIKKVTAFLTNDKKLKEEKAEVADNDDVEENVVVKEEVKSKADENVIAADEKISEKIKTMQDKIPLDYFDKLMSDMDFNKKIKVLDDLIEMYSDNPLLVAELVFIKKFIQYNCIKQNIK